MGFIRVTSDHFDGMFELDGESAKVGRSRDNKIRLPHKSVSRHHAVVTEEDGRLVIKDLASSYGTFINEDKISEGHADEGDVIRFGRVRVVYEREREASAAAPETPAAAPPPPPESAPAAGEPAANAEEAGEGRPCDKHPGKMLSLVCPKCRLRFCDSCVNKLKVSGVEKAFCPYCKETCKPLTLYQIEEDRRRARESRTFFRSLPQILGHPFSAGAIPLLFIGTLLYLGLAYLGRFSAYATIPVLFFLAAYAQRIVAAAAEGEDALPAWPNPADPWEGVARPGLMFCLSTAVAFLPLIAYLWSVMDSGQPARPSALFPLAAWGLIYLPFSVMSTSVADDFAAANPITVLSSFSRLHLQFMFAAVLALVMVGIRFLLGNVFAVFITLPAVADLLTGFVTTYFLLLELRLLGTLYFTNRNELRWHDE